MTSATLTERIKEDLKGAMKSRDTAGLAVLRSLLSALKYAAIEKLGADGELEGADAFAVVRKQIKQREDSLESFRKAQREDLAATEEAEIAALRKYLPPDLSPQEVVALVETCIAETGAATRKDMGPVMKLLQDRAAGRTDNQTLSREVMLRLG